MTDILTRSDKLPVVYTWATKPQAGDFIGQKILLSDYYYAEFMWTGTVWEILEGNLAQVAHVYGNPYSSKTAPLNAEQVLYQKTFDAGVLQAGQEIIITTHFVKDVNNGNYNIAYRFGKNINPLLNPVLISEAMNVGDYTLTSQKGLLFLTNLLLYMSRGISAVLPPQDIAITDLLTGDNILAITATAGGTTSSILSIRQSQIQVN